eukprot:213002_1
MCRLLSFASFEANPDILISNHISEVPEPASSLDLVNSFVLCAEGPHYFCIIWIFLCVVSLEVVKNTCILKPDAAFWSFWFGPSSKSFVTSHTIQYIFPSFALDVKARHMYF